MTRPSKSDEQHKDGTSGQTTSMKITETHLSKVTER